MARLMYLNDREIKRVDEIALNQRSKIAETRSKAFAASAKPEYIIGISLGHDSSAALLRNDEHNNWEILAAVSEERFTRKKNEDRIPVSSIKYVAGHIPQDKSISSLAYSSWEKDETFDLWNRWISGKFDTAPPKHIGSIKTEQDAFNYRLNLSESEGARTKDALEFRELLAKVIEESSNIKLQPGSLIRIRHHTAHALSAWFLSGFERCTVFTMDGIGDGISLTVNRAGARYEFAEAFANPIDTIATVGNEGSLGLFYKYVTSGLGFQKLREEGKVTGLAAYGDPTKCFDQLLGLFRFNDSLGTISGWNIDPSRLKEVETLHPFKGKLNPIDSWVEYHAFGRQVEGLVKGLIRQGISREDIAAATQAVFEEITLRIIDRSCGYISDEGPGKGKVALAGGVFGNVKLNQAIAGRDFVNELFVVPPMGDPGVAIGAAMAAMLKGSNAQEIRPSRIQSVSWGPDIKEDDVANSIYKFKGEVDHELVKDQATLYRRIAMLLAEGKLVARVHGRMEFGPRALGNRTIYAPAYDKAINGALNSMLGRSEFMPFAPIVLHDYAAVNMKNFNKVESCMPFMTVALEVSEDFRKRFPAAVHIDGTARAQSVRFEQNPDPYMILKEYEKITGNPVLINTSFNMHGEPIVCSPEEAISSFLAARLDALVMESHIIKAANK